MSARPWIARLDGLEIGRFAGRREAQGALERAHPSRTMAVRDDATGEEWQCWRGRWLRTTEAGGARALRDITEGGP